MNLLIEKNLVRMIAYGPFVFIPLFVVIISLLVINQNLQRYNDAIQDLESSYIETQKNVVLSKLDSSIKLINYQQSITEKMLKEKVKSRVDSAYLVAKNITEQNINIRSPQEIQKMIIDSLRPLVWNGGESFIFILNYDGIFSLAPRYLRHLEGHSVINFQDATGRYVIREEIALAKISGEGYMWDTFTRPAHDPKIQFKQLAYIKKFGDYNWYIGSAEYLDTTTQEMEKSTLDVLNNSISSDSEYFFIIDKAGKVIAPEKNSNLLGKNILSLKDVDGKEFVKELMNSVNSNHPHWITYKWNNPISQKIDIKHSYVKKVPNSNWLIGSGFYMEQYNKKIALKKAELEKANQKQLGNMLLLSSIILFFSFIISYFMSKMIQKRFIKYAEMIEVKNNELSTLNLGLENIIDERTAELHEAYEKMEKIAVTDALTHIYNRYFFNDALQNEINRANRYNSFFSLLMFDIDHFKQVNDVYGHDVGDQVLIKIVDIAASCLRGSDIFARIGGEEFMIILPQTTLESSIDIGERLRVSVQEYTFDNIGKITISLGVAQYRKEETFKEIVKRVDTALYDAKNNGRNRLIPG
ncbi:MAG: cache domain-containing protein [Sulfuricurvum sp.]|nr:cache domain-containing protein [Sulfuricurvum sp.]MDP3587187.1 cache domain-containing protein [Sulfuricurvum sp.]